MEHTILIPTAVDECGRGFLSLADRLKEPSRFTDQLPVGLILDEFDRFKLWAGNIAAHRKGRRSLETRLRDAPQLKTDTLGQLDFLSSTLKEALGIVEGERIPWDEHEFSDSDSDLSDIETSNTPIRNDTELKQLYGSVKTAVTSLMRISMAIREPAQSSQSRSIDKTHFEVLDMRHVQDKFPTAPAYLCKRLGLAITSRRQYLTYREEHHDKLAKGIDKLGLEAARTEFTTNSTEATHLQRTDSLKITDDVEDTASMTSYATSVNATLRAPSVPKEALQKEHYNCPYCYRLLNIHTTVAWKRHLYQDLHPYCCTFEDCATADRLYDSRHSWFAHELEAHHSTFQCVEGCSKVYKTEAEFESHIRSNHDDFLAPNLLSALKRTANKNPSLKEMATCGLCNKSMTFRAMQKHLGHHQEQLALFALPPNLDDTEEDANVDDQESQMNDGGSRIDKGEEPIEISDASGSEESESSDDEEPQRIVKGITTSCICNNERSGSMIRCSNNCERKWFHPRCVGASSEDSNYPAWYCPDCRKMRGTDAHGNPVSDVTNAVVGNVPREDAKTSPGYDQLQQLSGSASDAPVYYQADAIDQVSTSPAKGKSRASLSDDMESRVQKDHTRESESRPGSERMFDTSPSANRESTSSIAQDFWQNALEPPGGWSLKEQELLAEGTKETVTQALAEWTKRKGGVEAAREVARVAVEKTPKKWPEESEHDVSEERNRIVREHKQEGVGREALGTHGLHRTISQGFTVKPQVTDHEKPHTKLREDEKQPVHHDEDRLITGKDLKTESEEEKRTREARLDEGADETERASASSMAGSETSKKDTKKTLSNYSNLSDQEETAKTTEEERKAEEAMRERLKQFGFEKHQIDAMMYSKEAVESASAEPESSSLRAERMPTYAKIHKDHLDVETLHYYDIPYEYDNGDSNYIIVLREFNENETEILFEHTRRLRKKNNGNR